MIQVRNSIMESKIDNTIDEPNSELIFRAHE